MEDSGKQVVVGVCAMAKKSQSKPMKEILTRLQEFEYLKVVVFDEEVILQVRVGCGYIIVEFEVSCLLNSVPLHFQLRICYKTVYK